MLFSNYSKLYYYFNFSYFLKVRVERFPSKKSSRFLGGKTFLPRLGIETGFVNVEEKDSLSRGFNSFFEGAGIEDYESFTPPLVADSRPLINPRNPSFTRFETPSNISFVLPPFLSNRDHRILLLVCSAVSTKDQGSFL